MNIATLNDVLENEKLRDYLNKMGNLNYTVNDNTIDCLFILNDEQLKNAIANNLKSIQKLESQGKNNEFIQNFLNSNFYIFYETLPEEVKENQETLRLITKKYNEKTILEQTKWIKEMNQVSLGRGLLDLENKQKYLAICLEEESLKQNKKLALVLKGLPITQVFLIQKDLDKIKENSKKNAYFNKFLDKKTKNKEEKDTHLYNQEYYDFIKDEKLARDKIDTIKYAYFQNGINLEDFKKDLGNELYKCSNDQLENYVETYTRYQDGYLSRDEYFFSKEIIHNDYLTQEEIRDDVLPVIEDYNLTERQIKECIAMGADRDKGDTRTYLDLAVEAKEHNYSDFEINELLDDCKDKPTKNAFYKKEMIEEYGNDNITSVENLNNYTEKEMVYLLKERELALELNNTPQELTHEQIGVEL